MQSGCNGEKRGDLSVVGGKRYSTLLPGFCILLRAMDWDMACFSHAGFGEIISAGAAKS